MNYSEKFLASVLQCRSYGLQTMSCIATLAFLSHRQNGCYLVQIARLLKVSSAAVTGIADMLEKMKLAERKPVDGDRRSCRLVITAAGRDAMNLILNPKPNQTKV